MKMRMRVFRRAPTRMQTTLKNEIRRKRGKSRAIAGGEDRLSLRHRSAMGGKNSESRNSVTGFVLINGGSRVGFSPIGRGARDLIDTRIRHWEKAHIEMWMAIKEPDVRLIWG